MELTDCREVNVETGVIAISYALLTLRKRDIAIALDDGDLDQGHKPMHERSANAAEASEISRSVRDWQIVEHAGSGCAWRAAPEAEELAWTAAVSMATAGRIEKGAEF